MQTNVTIQTSVKVLDFVELYLGWFSTNYFQTSQFYGFKDALSSAVDGFFFSCPRQELKKPMDGSIIKDHSLLPKQPTNFFSFRLLLNLPVSETLSY